MPAGTVCDAKQHRRQEEEWRHHALRTLPVLMDATDMLVFGEDLGFVPGCLPPVMTVSGNWMPSFKD